MSNHQNNGDIPHCGTSGEQNVQRLGEAQTFCLDAQASGYGTLSTNVQRLGEAQTFCLDAQASGHGTLSTKHNDDS
jgi:hypothetical protein